MKTSLPVLSAADLARLDDLTELASDQECALCGQPFDLTPRKGGTAQRFCSRQCRQKYHRRARCSPPEIPVRGRPNQLDGQRFGRLVVIEEGERQAPGRGLWWRCLCDCGAECTVRGAELRRGIKVSCRTCGVRRQAEALRGIWQADPTRFPRPKEDLLGQRFGRLLVVRASSTPKGADKGARWVCLCDCGTESIVRAASLKRGGSQSCGCLHREINAARAREMHAAKARLRAEGHPVERGVLHRALQPGEVFGSLVVAHCTPYGGGHIAATCMCACGRKYRARASALRKGKTTRCRSCAAKATIQSRKAKQQGGTQ